MDPTLALLIFLLMFSGFFSGAEIALISLGAAKVKQMVDKKEFGSSAVKKLKDNPNKLLITILIGNNFVNIGASMITAIWATKVFGAELLGVVTGVLTLLILVFGEILPKSLAQRFNITFSKIVAFPLLFLSYLLFPIVFILEKFLNFTMKIVGGDAKMQTISKEELKAIVQLGSEEGSIDGENSEMLSNVLEFGETTAEEVMTDKTKLLTLSSETTIKFATDFFIKYEHSRVPVFEEGNSDKILGIITLQDIIKQKQNKNDDLKIGDLDLKQPIFIPETKKISDLFKEFQRKRIHMAIVIGEFGDVEGIVTMEDILEEIFGEIRDESDDEEDGIKKINEKSWRIHGDFEIEKLNKLLDGHFNYPDHKTVSYMLMDKLQKIPERGESIDIDGIGFFVEKMEGNKIELIRLQK
ncbi:hemolysin family protein [Candidatus Gracilibacteria bacterium]|nr:hemolysin family protein [Candidatus Gracilibacteria bacterium]